MPEYSDLPLKVSGRNVERRCRPKADEESRLSGTITIEFPIAFIIILVHISYSLKIFSHFDEKRPTLIELINMIPWPGSDGTYEGKQETWPAGLQSIHWVLAQFAARCYFAQERLDELFNLLVETSQWMDFDPGNSRFKLVQLDSDSLPKLRCNN